MPDHSMHLKDQILELVYSNKSIGSYDLAKQLNLEEAFVIIQVQQIIEHDSFMIVRRKGYGPSEYEFSIMPNYAGIVKSFLQTGGFTKIHHENLKAHKQQELSSQLERDSKIKGMQGVESQITYNKKSLVLAWIAIGVSIASFLFAFYVWYVSK